MAASKSIKTYFLQYDDQIKMWNTPSKIMNYEHKWVNANNEANPLRVKYTIEMVIFQNGHFSMIIEKGNKRERE